MVTGHSINPRPLGANTLPAPGTPAGTRARNDFIAQVTAICGGADNVRLFWLPKITDTTTTTSVEKDARTFTYDATIAARLSAQGSGVAVDFDGTDDEADTPDADDFSFGDGANDSPFSVVALVNPDTIAGTDTILAKLDSTTGNTKREWKLDMNAGAPRIRCWDESANAVIGRSAPAISTATWVLLTGTYDGTRAGSGFALYNNEARVDNADAGTGTYTAMENLAALVTLGQDLGTGGTVANLFDGKMAFVLLAARQFQQDEVYAIMAACNAYFNLELT